MSLDNPTKTEKILTAWKGWPMAMRVGVPLVIGLVILGAVLFGASKVSNWWGNRQIDKARANVNAALVELKQAEANKAADETAVAVAVEKVKQAAEDVVIASNTAEKGREEINAATQNLANVAAANRPTGTVASDLEKKLDQLGVQ